MFSVRSLPLGTHNNGPLFPYCTHREAVIWKTVSVSLKLSTFIYLSFYEKKNAVKAENHSDEMELLLFQWGCGTNEVWKINIHLAPQENRSTTQPLWCNPLPPVICINQERVDIHTELICEIWHVLFSLNYVGKKESLQINTFSFMSFQRVPNWFGTKVASGLRY